MNDNDENLDLLDLDDDTSLDDSLPDATPFAAPRPKKPWLLLGVGVLVIIVATYIIVRTIGSGSNSSLEVDLDAPVAAPAEVAEPVAVPDATVVPAPVQVAPVPTPVPVEKPAPVATTAPVRVIEDRKDVKFNPAKASAPVAKPDSKPVAAKPVVARQAQVAPKSANWYVQFGSYGTRAAAESAQKRVSAEHQGLFVGKQFVVLAAVLPNGTTTYRLRIGFSDYKTATGFCQNAKSDGLDCYVAK